MVISGIYKITNIVTGNFYIGSSKNIFLRWADHKKPSALKRYKSQQLYKDFVLYSLSNFKFEIIEELSEGLKEREQYYIGILKPYYNVKKDIYKYNKNKKSISAVYMIKNVITNEIYIGSSSNIQNRWHVHRNSINYLRYPNSLLYKNIHKYGIKNFEFSILEECSVNKLLEREQFYIDKLKPEYNIAKAKSNLTATEATREKYKKNRDKIVEYKRNYNKSYIGNKLYYSRKCLYNGEVISFSTCRKRLENLGFKSPTEEAKKYLIST